MKYHHNITHHDCIQGSLLWFSKAEDQIVGKQGVHSKKNNLIPKEPKRKYKTNQTQNNNVHSSKTNSRKKTWLGQGPKRQMMKAEQNQET